MVEKKSVFFPCQQINRESNDEIKFGPGKGAQNADRAGTESVNQHQENDSDNDSGMRDEKADEAKIGKSVAQVRRQECLQSSANSPEIGHLQPAAISSPKCTDDNNHRPIAQLKWKQFVPVIDPEPARNDHVGDIINRQQRRDRERDGTLESPRFGSMDDKGEEKGQNDCQEDDRE